jgi:peptidoglycan hydrolase-like protein with peptidoglycan-binding domain
MASAVGKQTWIGLATAVVAVAAIAALAPSLWQERTRPAPTATAPSAMQSPAPAPAPPPTPKADTPAPPTAAPSPPPSPPQPMEPARPLTTTQIAQLQGRLRALGFDPGKVDGIAGPRTVAAVTEFQTSHNLPVTGKIDTRVLDDVSTIQARTMGSRQPR